ncbi:bifunctional hydroxymethylpyrimidine kinase/phosphomethylpyrimidine kinase [Caldanaerobius polysaccharolyticus]|uniref:bifunctional hydroxymethylpyrimidine kinase/phosphomethylpyrimidine kinase n=1 Tax=Caldanaerobius polysaccharolyticus TaxID=44256 RepID=UPI00047CC48F|nr:bifunctional hydroxymethylpyrimidine kinase/phosphomethylpyrimidine kinase [Caldanaerobius polysaccharolyticus]
MKLALTIAGSDSGGGAGIQADLKTYSAHGVYGMSVITSITAQNTTGVLGIEDISPEMVALQIKAIFEDLYPDAVKIGMVSNEGIIESIAGGLKNYKPEKVVLDPVMISKSGNHLLKPEAIEALKRKLIPLSLVVTPNLMEAGALSGFEIKDKEDMKEAAKKILDLGAKTVVVKGGHLTGDALDIFYDGKVFYEITSERINTENTHGTGCTFSSAIAANLALGYDLLESIKRAKNYITGAIKHSLGIGHGVGPTNHFWNCHVRGDECEY